MSKAKLVEIKNGRRVFDLRGSQNKSAELRQIAQQEAERPGISSLGAAWPKSSAHKSQ